MIIPSIKNSKGSSHYRLLINGLHFLDVGQEKMIIFKNCLLSSLGIVLWWQQEINGALVTHVESIHWWLHYINIYFQIKKIRSINILLHNFHIKNLRLSWWCCHRCHWHRWIVIDGIFIGSIVIDGIIIYSHCGLKEEVINVCIVPWKWYTTFSPVSHQFFFHFVGSLNKSFDP